MTSQPFSEAATAPPGDGWAPIQRGGPFTQLIGPIYQSLVDLEPRERIRFGMRIRQQHCNPRLVCHGGMLATFLDVALACALREWPGVSGALPTISMNLDYLAAVACGAWMESRVEVQRVGGTIGFVSGLVIGPDGPVLRGSGTFRIFRTRD